MRPAYISPAYKSHKHLRAQTGQEGPRPRVDSPVSEPIHHRLVISLREAAHAVPGLGLARPVQNALRAGASSARRALLRPLGWGSRLAFKEKPTKPKHGSYDSEFDWTKGCIITGRDHFARAGCFRPRSLNDYLTNQPTNQTKREGTKLQTCLTLSVGCF